MEISINETGEVTFYGDEMGADHRSGQTGK